MITGQVTEREYISAHKLARRRLISLLNRILILAVATGLALALAGPIKSGVVLAFAGIGGLLGEFVHGRILLPVKLRRLYSQIKGRVDVTYSWDDEQLFLASERGRAQRSWNDFLKARENDEVILLYVNDALYEIIAKRWFREDGDLQDFRRHLKFVK